MESFDPMGIHDESYTSGHNRLLQQRQKNPARYLAELGQACLKSVPDKWSATAGANAEDLAY